MAPTPLAKAFFWRAQHKWLLGSFVMCVVIPFFAVSLYLTFIAQPQYASTVAFAVHKAGDNAAVELLSGFAEMQGSVVKQTDILYDYLRSQNMIEALEVSTSITTLWHRPNDPIFGLHDKPSIEALHRYAKGMIRIHHDPQTGLITIRSLAFDPDASTAISAAILDQAQRIVQQLPTMEHADHMSQAQSMFAAAQSDLIAAQSALAAFQKRHLIMDPTAQTAGQVEFISSLQHQKAQALIDYDLLLSEQTRPGDPRLTLAQKRIEVIDDLITQERTSLGRGDISAPQIAADFAQLSLKLQFAQEAYLSARTAWELAQVEAQKATMYVVPHIGPTKAQSARYPRKILWIVLTLSGALLIWAAAALVWYSFRDKR